MIVKIGGTERVESTDAIARLSILLWGQPGVGKTTFAATMPGRKALINFDPDGHTSVIGVPNLDVFDLSGTTHEITKQFHGTDPLGIKSAIKEYDSIIIDSLSSIEDRTFDAGISKASKDSVPASIERPSQSVYLTRNNLMHHLVRLVLNITGAEKKHLCLLAHEQTKVNAKDQSYQHTLALGGQLVYKVPSNVNECIVMYQDGKKKDIIISSNGFYTPVKTRMFTTMKGDRFTWKFNPDDWTNPNNMTLAQMYEIWKLNKFRKIPLPGTPEYDKMKDEVNATRTD